MSRYPRILAAFLAEPWAIEPTKLEAIVEFLELQAAGVKFDEDQIEARIGGARMNATARKAGSVAVIPIVGVISHRVPMLSAVSGGGGTSSQQLSRQLRAALDDDSVKAIVLDVDSPGGAVVGTDELSAEIFEARGRKPIIASVNGAAASAAYWIASAAEEVVASPTSQVGSIGVIATHVDQSKADEIEGVKRTFITAGRFKAEGNPHEPLSDEARETLQETVDAYYDMFVRAVARNRGVTPAAVKSDFGEGRMLRAELARKAGMVDRIETLSETLARLGVGGSPASGVRTTSERAEDERPEPTAAQPLDLLRRRVAIARID